MINCAGIAAQFTELMLAILLAPLLTGWVNQRRAAVEQRDGQLLVGEDAWRVDRVVGVEQRDDQGLRPAGLRDRGAVGDRRARDQVERQVELEADVVDRAGRFRNCSALPPLQR